jgi:hypothetical protein
MKLRALVAVALLCGGAAAVHAADSLLEAAEAGNSAAAMALVAGKADVNAHQEDGTTALHWAAYHDDLPLLQQLISAGAKVNVSNDYGSTPLNEAACCRRARMWSRPMRRDRRHS